ncbi:MAG TPA: hypothetical protein VNM67_08130 [Thermoanaerobaculia bacterium]|jgi:hypothetical protein|nr:hypothetical protein [Thermoanaerobaculia bacterium]
MKSLPITIALSLLFTLGAAHAASPASPRKTDAHQLLRLAEAGLGDTVHAAESSEGRLDRAKPEQQPFWRAVDKMNAVLRRVRAGMMARDESFFRALEDGSVALGELRVVWARTAVPDLGVNEGIRILSESYQLLRTGYGRESVRHRKGRGLSEAERERFLRIQQAQRQFADLLRELQEIARKRNDAAALAELRRMEIDAERIAAAQLTLNAYLNALMIGDSQRGEWTGNAQYAAPGDRSEWQEAETVIEDLYTEEEVGHVYALDLGTLPNTAPSVLTHLEEPTELPDSLAADAAEIDPIEEQEAFYEEEMEEGPDTDLEAIEEIVVVEDEEAVEGEEEVVEKEIVLEEGEDAEEKAEATEAKTGEKTEVKPAEAVDPKKKQEPAPAPVTKDSKKKSVRPPS